jgi:hypothetical protein
MDAIPIQWVSALAFMFQFHKHFFSAIMLQARTQKFSLGGG